MLTKAQSKYIRSLGTSTGRRDARAFLVEGTKLAEEWTAGKPGSIEFIVASAEWLEWQNLSPDLQAKAILTTDFQREALTNLQTTPPVILVVAQPRPTPLLTTGWTLAGECLQDPGNLGTLLRIADWYGVHQVVTSPDSADFWNPKVVQSAMGAHLRVALHRTDLEPFLMTAKVPVIAATLSGTPVQQQAPLPAGILLLGNESRGLRAEILRYATLQCSIPRRGGAESLNVAVAAGILCDRLLPLP